MVRPECLSGPSPLLKGPRGQRTGGGATNRRGSRRRLNRFPGRTTKSRTIAAAVLTRGASGGVVAAETRRFCTYSMTALVRFGIRRGVISTRIVGGGIVISGHVGRRCRRRCSGRFNVRVDVTPQALFFEDSEGIKGTRRRQAHCDFPNQNRAGGERP